MDQQRVSSSPQEGQATGHYVADLGRLLAQQVAAPTSAREQQARVRFGQYIQSARHYHGLSRPALALQLGIKEAEVYGLEAGLLSTAHIGLNLLPNLACVLDEDPALLHQLLRVGGNDRQPSLDARLRGGWRRGRIARLFHDRKHGYALLTAYLIRITDRCLLHNHLPNLVNRLQPSRLTVYTTTVLAAIVLSFWTVHWLSVSQPAIVRTTFSESAQVLRSSHRGMDLPTSAEQRHNPAKYHTIGHEVAPDPGPGPLPNSMVAGRKANVSGNYQIVYTPNPPVVRDVRAAYITVDDAQIAIIFAATQAPPLPDAHCSSIGRFSLCPI